MRAVDYWNERYSAGGNSGYGSYGAALTRKIGWLKGLDIKTISEIGCGDLNLASNLLKEYPNALYNGHDISEMVVIKDREKYPLANITTELDLIPGADLVLCIDVILHILEDSEVEPLLQELDKRWTKYLAITAYERDETLDSHVRIRKFDPSRFGTPIIREIAEENGEMYFYLFKR